ncbi:MAG: RNA polymerase factor sigma-54 [Kiritimatiellae bacterium]|nr:RNA polymerase factor sigma-54 [Kiritimatiellia bacterium]MDD4735573.1 RNA polymerase factor sigma-54 [Kiritimatiellia bacterium]
MANQFLSQTQQQRLSQVLAPQLRQSLHLLQVPILELQSVIQEELQTNPTLEERLTNQDPLAPAIEDEKPPKPGEEPPDEAFEQEFQVLAHLDDEWRDYFQMDHFNIPYTRDDAARREFFMNSISQSESLQEHLLRQLTLGDMSKEEVKIGELLIGNINDDGYFTSSTEELARSTGCEKEMVDEVLSVIQEFSPIGVGSRDLRECLLLQLNRLGLSHSPAAIIIQDHLDRLAAKKLPDIARAMKIPVEEVQSIAHFIATLEPKPGRMFSAETPTYVLPEVIVQKVNDDYIVIVNNDQIPHLHISRHYRKLMEDTETSTETKKYIREKIQSSKFLINSIHQRQQTIYRIATEIVRVQRPFLDHGITHLSPLTMSEIANVLGVHETTVSRAIANKYMQTPRGVFEMKYFFTPGFKNDAGASISNMTIKDTIEQMVRDEDPGHPLSDQDIVGLLKENGLSVARRTIAKYRDQLNIQPSHLRKSY